VAGVGRGFHWKDQLISHLARGPHESKQQTKMLACEQEQAQAPNAAMMEVVGWDLEASIYALDYYDPRSSILLRTFRRGWSKVPVSPLAK
jgi:hypothetical protein